MTGHWMITRREGMLCRWEHLAYACATPRGKGRGGEGGPEHSEGKGRLVLFGLLGSGKGVWC
eukprot:8648945-Lingulodinium_polyedra.AAC.1